MSLASRALRGVMRDPHTSMPDSHRPFFFRHYYPLTMSGRFGAAGIRTTNA
jgi:hypothetical protein